MTVGEANHIDVTKENLFNDNVQILNGLCTKAYVVSEEISKRDINSENLKANLEQLMDLLIGSAKIVRWMQDDIWIY